MNVLKIKLGYVIQLLNWYKYVNKNESELENANLSQKWKKPIGYYKKLKLFDRYDLTNEQIKAAYDMEIKKAIPWGISFPTITDLEHFISHIQYIFDMPIKYKIKHTHLGLFWFKWGYSKDWTFNLKFSRISNLHLISLKQTNFDHNHYFSKELETIDYLRAGKSSLKIL